MKKHDKDFKDINSLFHFISSCCKQQTSRRADIVTVSVPNNNIRFFLWFVFETERQDGRIGVITETASFCLLIFTCIYQQRYMKKLSLGETTRSVLKFYHCVFFVLFLFQQTRPPTWSGKEKTFGTVGLLISQKRNSPSWTLLLLLNVLSKIVYYACSPVWTTWRVSLSTSLLF